MRQLFAYAQLVRLPNTFTAWADILLGALATGFLSSRFRWFVDRLTPMDRSADIETPLASICSELAQWCILVCLLAASTLLYWSGMVWNDYFDVEQDRLERPSRPIPSGRVPLRAAMLLAVGLMVGAVAVAFVADLLAESQRFRSGPIALALIVAIFLYDGVAKSTWLGPVFMGACRFLNVLLGLSVVNAMPPSWGWVLASVVGLYIGGVTWFAKTEARESSQSMLVSAAAVMLAALVLALTIPALALERTRYAEPSALYPYILAAFGGYLGIAVVKAIRRPEPSRVQRAVRRAILGLIVLDALLASAFVGVFGLLLVLLLIPGMILGRWLYST